MTDIQAAVDDLLAAFERHPGHSPQSVHGGKGKAKAAAKKQADQQATFQAKMKELADWREGKAPIPEWYAEMNKKKLDKEPRQADDELFYHRGYTAERGGSPGDPIRFLASTPGVKRDGLDLRANGWMLDNYRKSPVFQWCHDKTMPPLGRVDAEAKTSLHAAVTFDQEDDFARKVESKYRRGFLHSVSVGWDFVDGHGTRLNTGRLSLDEIRDRAFYDLTEISGVPVPADPDALVQRTRAGLRSLGRELVALYDEQENPDGQALAEEVRQALYDELNRMGIPPDLFQRFAAHAQQPANPAGFFMPNDPAPAVPGIDQNAARALLAAFQLEGVK